LPFGLLLQSNPVEGFLVVVDKGEGVVVVSTVTHVVAEHSQVYPDGMFGGQVGAGGAVVVFNSNWQDVGPQMQV
jgi:hypothetical protein